MNRLICLLLLALLPYSCQKLTQQDFKKLVSEFHQDCKKHNYILADSILVASPAVLQIPNATFYGKIDSFAANYRHKIQRFKAVEFDAAMQFEYDKILGAVEKTPIYYNQMQDYDPSRYDVGPTLRHQMLHLKVEDAESWQVLKSALALAESYYNAGKVSGAISDPEKIELAIRDNSDTYFFLTETLDKTISKSKLSDSTRQQIIPLIEEARLAVKDYVAFCNSLKFEYYDHAQRSKPN